MFNIKNNVAMKLMNWNLNEIKNKFPKIIEKFSWNKKDNDTSSSSIPSVNIADEDKAFEINVIVPGIDKKDLKLEVQDRCLIISSEKKFENNEENKNWIRKEYGYSMFQRIFKLPENADENKIFAELKNGILTIKVAKSEKFMDNKKLITVK
jgi:HSP20 family protein